jgi:hypothetical protein
MNKQNQIKSYFHCTKCILEGEPPNVAVGIIGAGTHLQIWCENHKIALGLFELREPWGPPRCDMCEEGVPHTH